MSGGVTGPEFSNPLERVRASFGKQGLMTLLGAEVVEAKPGVCVIEVPFRDELTQQERFFMARLRVRSRTTPGAMPR